jgi:hypothetical protein
MGQNQVAPLYKISIIQKFIQFKVEHIKKTKQKQTIGLVEVCTLFFCWNR